MQRIRFTKSIRTTLYRCHVDGYEQCWSRTFQAGEVHPVGESSAETTDETTVLELLRFDAFAEIPDDCFEWVPVSLLGAAACAPLFN